MKNLGKRKQLFNVFSLKSNFLGKVVEFVEEGLFSWRVFFFFFYHRRYTLHFSQFLMHQDALGLRVITDAPGWTGTLKSPSPILQFFDLSALTWPFPLSFTTSPLGRTLSILLSPLGQITLPFSHSCSVLCFSLMVFIKYFSYCQKFLNTYYYIPIDWCGRSREGL